MPPALGAPEVAAAPGSPPSSPEGGGAAQEFSSPTPSSPDHFVMSPPPTPATPAAEERPLLGLMFESLRQARDSDGVEIDAAEDYLLHVFGAQLEEEAERHELSTDDLAQMLWHEMEGAGAEGESGEQAAAHIDAQAALSPSHAAQAGAGAGAEAAAEAGAGAGSEAVGAEAAPADTADTADTAEGPVPCTIPSFAKLTAKGFPQPLLMLWYEECKRIEEDNWLPDYTAQQVSVREGKGAAVGTAPGLFPGVPSEPLAHLHRSSNLQRLATTPTCWPALLTCYPNERGPLERSRLESGVWRPATHPPSTSIAPTDPPTI
jgi:hypothetical protein